MSDCKRNGMKWSEFCSANPGCPGCWDVTDTSYRYGGASVAYAAGSQSGFYPPSGYINTQRTIAQMVLSLDSAGITNQEALDMAISMRMESWNLDTADIIHLAISRRSKIANLEDVGFLQRNLTEHAALLDAVGRTYEADVLRNILDGYALYTANGGNPVEQNPPPSQEVPPTEGKVMMPKN